MLSPLPEGLPRDCQHHNTEAHQSEPDPQRSATKWARTSRHIAARSASLRLVATPPSARANNVLSIKQLFSPWVNDGLT